MKHKRQEECGWIRGMYEPEKEGEYLVKRVFEGDMVAKYDGEFWEENIDILCWTFIPDTKIDAPF